MYSILKKTLDHQFIKFLLTGGLNTIFGYLSFAFFNFIIGNAYLAVPVSTIAGVLFNFKTYGKFVFKSNDHSMVYRFLGVYLLIIGLQMLSLKWLNNWGVTNSYLAVGLMVLPMSVISFILMRRFVFTIVPALEVETNKNLDAKN